MRILDLFCGAGGAAMGYYRAGFDVIGVDIAPQPNYPFTFTQGDALKLMDELFSEPRIFDAVHASPPCQGYSSLKSMTTGKYPLLVDAVRARLEVAGLPYVIENVVGAPLRSPITLCGSSFGLGVWRHRLFELNFPPPLTPPCSHAHHPKPLDVTGTGGPSSRPRTSPGGGLSRKPANLAEAREAMGIDWMTRRELSESIPPAYTEFIGRHLAAHIGRLTEQEEAA